MVGRSEEGRRGDLVEGRGSTAAVEGGTGWEPEVIMPGATVDVGGEEEEDCWPSLVCGTWLRTCKVDSMWEYMRV